MATMSFASTLLEKIQRSSDTSSYRFSRPADYAFKAGQWFTITIESPDGPLDHHFSHADSPTEFHIELTTRLTGSPFKTALDTLPIGARADIEGPYGAFLFGYEKSRIAFLTGGIGVTPIRSMLRYLADTNGAGRVAGQELTVFYGSMSEDGVVYKDDFDEFEHTIPGLRVVHVITAPTPDWKGYGGFITAGIIRAELSEPADWTYYVVGPPPMVSAMDKTLGQLEIPQSHIVVESFAGYAS